MATEPWLPIGYVLPDGAKLRRTLYGDFNWQIVETHGHGRALVVRKELMQRWASSGLLEEGTLAGFNYGEQCLWSLSSGPSQVLSPVSDGKSPNTKIEALAFAAALKATRAIDAVSPLQDSLYVEKYGRLLPTFTISSQADDDVVLGYWLSGGAPVSALAFRRLNQMLSWIGPDHLKDVIESAGFTLTETALTDTVPSLVVNQQTHKRPGTHQDGRQATGKNAVFVLAGRPQLTTFFNEHVIDIIKNAERYKLLGIDFPSAIVLHGPPGCGKTYAVEKLADYLEWPNFRIDSSSVGSPYIHQTSVKIAQVFDQAIANAPSVLVIDEMEAFLTERDSGNQGHRVEEVAEFLRRIPEAVKNRVLIVAMTNRLEMIDVAILRRGRFDYIVNVDYANEDEVYALIDELLKSLPRETGLEFKSVAKELTGRPLSDVAFVVREAARLAARSGNSQLTQDSLTMALNSAPARAREGGAKRRIGFV